MLSLIGFHPECQLNLNFYDKVVLSFLFPHLVLVSCIAIGLALTKMAKTLENNSSAKSQKQIPKTCLSKCLYGIVRAQLFVCCRLRSSNNKDEDAKYMDRRLLHMRANLHNGGHSFAHIGVLVCVYAYTNWIQQMLLVFNCIETPMGKMLEADISIACPSLEVKALFGVCLAIFGAGTPILLFAIVYLNQSGLKKRKENIMWIKYPY